MGRRLSVGLVGTLLLSAATPAASQRPVTFTSLSPETAVVSSNGVVTGLREGLAQIVAQSGRFADTAYVTVTRAPGLRYDWRTVPIVCALWGNCRQLVVDVLTRGWNQPRTVVRGFRPPPADQRAIVLPLVLLALVGCAWHLARRASPFSAVPVG